jgi:Mg2+ and Co2+ transporter CorA
MTECQLYKYNSEFYAVERDEPSHFVNDFVESEIDSDYVSWLNFHGVQDKISIEKLCQKLKIDKLSIETIYNFARRPKVEEYAEYILMSSNLNKRMMNMLVERLKSQIQVIEQ